MTKSLAISARQITAICKGAAKAGFIAEVIIGGVAVRLIPKADAQPERPIATGADDDLDAELAAFEAKHGDD